MPLLSKEEWRESRERKEGGSGRGNLGAACFAAIKTTEVELLPKRKAGRKEGRRQSNKEGMG